MFKKVFVCSVLFLNFFIFSPVCFSQKILSRLEITSSYEDSLLLAKDQNKKVFVFFTGSHCSWCTRQKEVFMQPEVSNLLNNNYVVCYIDTSKRRDISLKYKIRSIPSYFIIDQKENIINKNIGFKNKNDFIRWLQK